jgi:G3E family GTPase
MAPDPEHIPVAVLTGFLGSGKTTLLNRLLRLPELRDTAVIVNEFGAIGIDHLLVERASADPVLLENGCLCCSARGELAAALDGLRRRRARREIVPFQRVVIETTGLAMPAPIVEALRDPDVAPAFALAGIVATIDGLCGARTLDRHDEARRQAAIADRLVITKTDVAGSNCVALAERLRALNPVAAIDCAAEMVLGKELLFGTGFDTARDKTCGGEGHPHEGIETFCLVRDRPIAWDGFKLWISVLASLCGERLLRVKGFIAVAEAPDRPFLVQGVQDVFEPPVQLSAWPSDDHRTRLVFITEGLPRDVIAETMDLWSDFGVGA